MADLTGDGTLDLISGCYSPGRVYVFAGDGKGGYAKATTLEFATGKPLTTGSAMHVSVVDWDRDGDLDLLIGNIKGDVHVVPNTGDAKRPVWGAPKAVEAPGAAAKEGGVLKSIARKLKPDEPGKPGPINAPGGDAGPMLADWDGDGAPDLVLGCGDGSVVWYRNTTKSGEPTFEAARTLVPGKSWNDGKQTREGGLPAELGDRAKVCVADWNGDGRLDLLVGDFSSSEGPAPKLTKEQEAERDELLAKQEKLWSEMSPLYEAAQRAAEKASGVKQNEMPTEEQQDAWSEAYSAALKADPRYVELEKRSAELGKRLKPLTPEHRTDGYVWVFPRRAAGAAPPAAGTR